MNTFFPYENGEYTSYAVIDGAEYTVDCKLNKGCYTLKSGSDTLSLNGDWLIDLETEELKDAYSTVSSGITFADRLPPDNKNLHGIRLYSVKCNAGVFFKGILTRFPGYLPIEYTENIKVQKNVPNLFEAYIGNVNCDFLNIDISVNDLQKAGNYLTSGKKQKMTVNVNNAPEGISVSLYGMCSGNVTPGMPFDVTPECKGIVPLAVAVYKEEKLAAFEIFEIKVLPVGFTCADSRLNGCYCEGLYSILQRKIDSVIPEEEPRGELLYPFSLWPRNFSGQTLSSFGFSEYALSFLKLLDGILLKDGFIKQNYTLAMGSDGRWGSPGIDGIGFYLWQWGKLMRKHPEYKPNPAAVRAALDFISFNTRWNGLISDGTEPADLFSSNKTAGCVYTQATVIAGMVQLSGSYKAIDTSTEEQELINRLDITAERLTEALKYDHRNTEYFSEYTAAYEAVISGNVKIFEPGMRDWYKMIWNMHKNDIYHAYSTAAPGVFFLSPESRVDGFDEKISVTADKIINERACDYNKNLLYTHFPRVDAYVQLGIVVNLLYLSRTEEAFGYLNEFLKYCNITSLGYILPECIDTYSYADITHIPKIPETAREKHSEFPFMYGDGKNNITEAENGYWRSPGNLIHIGYLFDIIDVMCGVYSDSDGITFSPHIPLKLLPFSVENYPSAYGKVSIYGNKDDNTVEYTLNGEKYTVMNNKTVNIMKEK